MKITSARVIVTCPGRNFVTLNIETDEGIYGLGDATLNGRAGLTSRPIPAFRQNMNGIPSPTCGTYRNCSRRYVMPMASRLNCCTM